MPKMSRRNIGFRGRKATAAAYDMLEVLIAREKNGLEGMTQEDIAALQALLVGRIVKRLGNGWCDVFCQDNKMRRCHIRGVLRSKKGGAYMDIDNIVVVALEKPMTELEDSDDEGNIGFAHGGGDKGYIVGLFGLDDIGKLKKTRINSRLFATVDANGQEHDDIFERDTDAQPKHVPRRLRKQEDSEQEIKLEDL